ncbi:MAG: damage-inducible protein DinB [Gemmatimonadetes bacterium]|nr:damage-inducible protein DinB [Gemmatimonadota bacterium]
MLEVLNRLLAHLCWADGAVLESFRSALPSARTLEIYAHILGAEHVWLSRLRQVKPRHVVWPTLDVAQCAVLVGENRDGYRDYLKGLNDSMLGSEVAYVNSAGQPFRSRVDDILLHVALHGSYHRGQVALLVRDAGAKPAPTDYIGFVRGVPAATRLTPVPSPARERGTAE